ncbi:tail assembly chaperone [Xanthomonas phage Bosa]|uniref:Phage protein n=3 Tax=Bosavirus TaxID=2946834 RepID=A0A679KET7_9CAUD|nr:tail assembly chaperone [Xanthomonas phage Bosa]YP_010739009.1 hypothetical protein P9A52_gp42 [Stenotrophomonas phage vB_SmaS-AXL_1]YP_010739087.1 hypothetical protein P9A53_gp37 [Xanthomonas phage vB_Xar_IVIA-DoCa6]YP_010739169.1 hypothetical protein P9A54_gp37 [Xanthomonas phage vB_Xar_IVIA-DoCa10]UIS24804.1 hypothetical protein AXL1_42 [Stenotrophomonas phage vB_SmaS-AXL_1]UYA98781.1 hypothetical protein IVIADoCa6_37 [Xanthomonas phage vB_Xar_IVIA-DoCa6]UYA99022.1 hypothetical protein 
MEHMRRLGYCSSGVRTFFQRNGLDYSAFLRDGIDADKLAETGDAMALAAVEESKNGRR